MLKTLRDSVCLTCDWMVCIPAKCSVGLPVLNVMRFHHIVELTAADLIHGSRVVNL